MANNYSEKLKDPRWQKKRLLILNRDNFTCHYCCDTEQTLHVHHLRYAGNPWEVEDKYLITLCESCHQLEHDNRKDVEKGLIKTIQEKGFSYQFVEGLIEAFEKLESFHADAVMSSTIAWAFSKPHLMKFLQQSYFDESRVRRESEKETTWL